MCIRDRLTQQTNPNDARAPVYSLSPAGQLAYEGISFEWQKRGASMASDIAPSALEDACKVLTTLLVQMESGVPPQESDQASDITPTHSDSTCLLYTSRCV